MPPAPTRRAHPPAAARRGLTLVRLAAATDLSHPFLSQLERGLAQPSLASLRRIAVALGTSPIELIAAAEAPASVAPAVEVHRRGDGALAADFAAGSARLLAHGDRPFRPLEYEGDNAEPGDHFVHDEDEFVYVLAGAGARRARWRAVRARTRTVGVLQRRGRPPLVVGRRQAVPADGRQAGTAAAREPLTRPTAPRAL